MRRREFLALVGGFTGAWAAATWGQPTNGVRRIGVLLAATSDDLHPEIFNGQVVPGMGH